MLKVENVTKKYGDLTAVNNLSFTVNDGEIFGLLGLNGAGKTTTFRMILGLIDDYSGKITLDDKPIDYTVTDKIGFLTEERSLLTKLTVLEQIKYYGALKSIPEEEIEDKLDHWLEIFGIKEYKNKKIKELSKGNQQKVQFISAIINEPKLLILDEPLNGLDIMSVDALYKELKEYAQNGNAVIFSTHIIDVLPQVCTDVAILENQKIEKYISVNESTDLRKVFQAVSYTHLRAHET